MGIFESLASTYPRQAKDLLYAQLGGQWPTLIDHPSYQNTCAIRLSVSFHASGYKIPKKFKEAMTGDGRNIIVKVKTMFEYVKELFGEPTWGMSKNPGTEVKIPGKRGIIVYHKAFSDATGHFDLWDSTWFVGAGKLKDVTDGFDLALWYWE